MRCFRPLARSGIGPIVFLSPRKSAFAGQWPPTSGEAQRVRGLFSVALVLPGAKREFVIDNLLIRNHFIIVMMLR